MTPQPSADLSPGPAADDVATAARRLLDRLRAAGLTVAVAESLTGGSVTAALVSVPGASAVLRGGVVAYASDVKRDLLGVPADLLVAHGAVHEDVALAMASGVRERLGADVGLATTGIAGPGPADGRPPGRVHVAVVAPAAARTQSVDLGGDRPAVRAGASLLVLELARQVVG